MFKAIWHEKQILIVLVWSGLVFIGYNILTVEATTEKNDSPKEICKDYDGKWKDGTCNFKNEDDEVAFDHYMADEGLWDDYAAKQQEQEQDKEFKEEEKENEGKRYVNPDGGAPLYEEELTEDEKDYYEEYKPEKEDSQQIEDWRNEVEVLDGPPPEKEEEIRDYKIASPKIIIHDEEEQEIQELEEEIDREEEEEEEEESDDEQEEDEPEEDNSDSES